LSTQIPLEDSSRTVGGSTRGRALGNVFSHADAGEILSEAGSKPIKGVVKIFKSCIDPTHTKPAFIIKSAVGSKLVPLLLDLATRYSSVSSKSIFLYIQPKLTYMIDSKKSTHLCFRRWKLVLEREISTSNWG
jgi:hypothetical protein